MNNIVLKPEHQKQFTTLEKGIKSLENLIEDSCTPWVGDADDNKRCLKKDKCPPESLSKTNRVIRNFFHVYRMSVWTIGGDLSYPILHFTTYSMVKCTYVVKSVLFHLT